MRAYPTSDQRRLSASIGIARVLCLLGIVYVHAWTGLVGSELIKLNDTPQGMLRWSLIELLGRSSVPLLSIISGWLVAHSLAKRGWLSFLGGKARAILAPMILWNALAIMFVSGAAWLGWIQAPLPTTWRWTIGELLSLTSPNDINVQMSFLRDLFICMLAAPLLVRLPNWALGVIAAITVGWVISGFSFILLLRPSILLFFVMGILARRHDLAVWMASRPIAMVGGAYAIMAAALIWLETRGEQYGINAPTLLVSMGLVMRFATALFFWVIAWRLADTRAARLILRFEPYAFLMFCSHLIMIWLGGPFIGQWTGTMGSPFYPAFLLAQPFLVLAATLVLGRALNAISPAAATLLSGGRLSSPSQERPARAAPQRPLAQTS